MALDGNVTIPGGGKVPKKAAAAGVVIVGTLIGVYYWRKRSSSSSAAEATTTAANTATAADQYPPDGSEGNPDDPYSTDPATGQTYGDEAAGAGNYGAFGDLAGGQEGNYDPTTGMYYDPATGQYDLDSPYTGATSTSGGPPFSSNNAWSQWVIPEIQSLDESADVDALTTAIGLYLDGQPVTPAQKTLILEATAIAGNPPVAGPNNYPPNVRTNGSTGPAPATTPVTVPNLKGLTIDNAGLKLESVGLKLHHNAPTKKGTVYEIEGQTPGAGTKVSEGSTVDVEFKVR